MPGECEERTEDPAVDRRGEEVEYSRAIARGTASTIEDRPPEKKSRTEKTQVLQHVHEIALKRRLKEIGNMPYP